MPKKRPSPQSTIESSKKSPDNTQDLHIPIVGIGASAGGLEAFEQFFRLFPVDSGIAFILVPHLDPDHESMLADILSRVTKMPVIEAHDLMDVIPNHVYIIQPNREMSIFHHKIHLSIPDPSRGPQMKIDLFFRSLSEEQGDKAIGIIFSGTGTDGTLGLRAIQGGGGLTFVQDPVTAKYDGMPTSAINSGYASFVLPVEQMPDQVISSVKILFGDNTSCHFITCDPVDSDKTGAVSRILRIIRSRTGHDFSQYKTSTIHRRIARRMAVHVIEDYAVYTRFLEEHPDEVKTLFRELLINVTCFFRDPEAFDSLGKDGLPEVIRKKGEYEPFRVWVPGCATGEEAYSLAIIIREILDDQGKDCKVQIYSTDIAEDVIAVARQGFYPPNIAADVSQDRLKKYFIREDNGFRVKKEIREMVIFAIQNVIKDPPFTKLDLISCRNLLIYLELEIQSRLIPVFHYALNTGGILFLSPSESIGSGHDLFKPINRKWKIYEASGTSTGVQTLLETPAPWRETHLSLPASDLPVRPPDTGLVELTRNALLQVYAPPSVVTDEAGNLLYVHGDTGKFLRPAPGQASLSVIEMAREGLELDLRNAILTARTQKIVVTSKNLHVRTNGGFETVNLEVRPILSNDSMQGGLIISFFLAESQDHLIEPGQIRRARRRQAKHGREEDLEQELQFTKENLQATVEEMQAANEELKSTNEELQSTNEELQSTNEELETSREELQSVNEEIMIINTELQVKIEQLDGMQNDMKNLIGSTGIGTVFLDIDLAIRRFTPEAKKVYKLVDSDVGRPLIDIKSMMVQDDLIEEAGMVLESLISREKEVQTIDNAWFLARVVPYRTGRNVIGGVVLTFTDISTRKAAEDEALRARMYAESIVDTIREPLLVLDQNLTVVSASRSFYRTFQTSSAEIIGKNVGDIGDRQWNTPHLISLLQTILPENASFEDIRMSYTFPDIGERILILNARGIHETDTDSARILLAMEAVHPETAPIGEKDETR